VLTGARTFHQPGVGNGLRQIVVSPDSVHLFTNVIEAPRLADEELPADHGIIVHAAPWHEPQALAGVMPK